MEKPKMPKQRIALIALSVALVICVAYIAFVEYQRVLAGEQITAYQQGAQYGYQQGFVQGQQNGTLTGYQYAVAQLMQEVSTCNQVPVTFGNQTINVIAVACLQQASSQ